MSKSDDRVLTFFVSGALLAGAAACSKEAEPDHPIPVESVEHVNPGPKSAVPPSVSIDAGSAIAKPAPPLTVEPEPDRVNTNFQEEPIVERDKAPTFRTNTGRHKPPKKKEMKTNTGLIEKTPTKDKAPDSK